MALVGGLKLSLSELQDKYTIRFWHEIQHDADKAGLTDLKRAVKTMLVKNRMSVPGKVIDYEMRSYPQLIHRARKALSVFGRKSG